MKGKFNEIISKFPKMLENLKNCQSLSRDELESLSGKQGIYVFYENGIPMYVGRSGRKDRFKKRIQEHSRPSSTHSSATFAFILAKEDSIEHGINTDKSRDDLEKEPEFAELYKNAKDRVSKMKLKVIEIDDPIEQTLFEVYAALELNTPYNEWGTH
jgi:hypothetical protein